MKFNKKDLKTLTNIITSRRDVRGNNFINKKDEIFFCDLYDYFVV